MYTNYTIDILRRVSEQKQRHKVLFYLNELGP